MKNLLKSLFLLSALGISILTSCGTAKTIVYNPVVIPSCVAINQVQITCGTNTVPISESVISLFEQQLRKKLYGDNKIVCGPEITLQYRFIQFDEGNRFARYMMGGIGNTGEASLMIEVTYFGPDGMEFGKIHTEGKISSGLFGGSSDNAISKAAAEVANYTRSLILNCEANR